MRTVTVIRTFQQETVMEVDDKEYEDMVKKWVDGEEVGMELVKESQGEDMDMEWISTELIGEDEEDFLTIT